MIHLKRIYLKYFGYNTKMEGYPNKFGYKRVRRNAEAPFKESKIY